MADAVMERPKVDGHVYYLEVIDRAQSPSHGIKMDWKLGGAGGGGEWKLRRNGWVLSVPMRGLGLNVLDFCYLKSRQPSQQEHEMKDFTLRSDIDDYLEALMALAKKED